MEKKRWNRYGRVGSWGLCPLRWLVYLRHEVLGLEHLGNQAQLAHGALGLVGLQHEGAHASTMANGHIRHELYAARDGHVASTGCHHAHACEYKGKWGILSKIPAKALIFISCATVISTAWMSRSKTLYRRLDVNKLSLLRFLNSHILSHLHKLKKCKGK